jgi:hypothetical protein
VIGVLLVPRGTTSLPQRTIGTLLKAAKLDLLQFLLLEIWNFMITNNAITILP